MRLSRFLFGEDPPAAPEPRAGGEEDGSEFCLQQTQCLRESNGSELQDDRLRIIVFQQDEQRSNALTLFDSRKVLRRDSASPACVSAGRAQPWGRRTDAMDISLERSLASSMCHSRQHESTGTVTPSQTSSQVFSIQKTPCFSTSPQWATSSGRSQPVMASSLNSGRSTPMITGVGRLSRNFWNELTSQLQANPPQKPETKSTRDSIAVDVKVLEEMAFGTLPMKGNSSGVKIHQLKAPRGLVFTYMFNLQVRKSGRVSLCSGLEDSLCTSPSSSISPIPGLESPPSFVTSSGSFAISRSSSERSLPHVDRSFTSSLDSRLHRGITNAPSSSPQPGSSATSSSGYSSLRTTRSKMWRGSWEIIRSSGSLMLTDSIGSQDDELVLHMRTPKFAISVLFLLPDEDRSVEEFLHTHWALVVRHMLRLRQGIECAVAGRQYLQNSTAFQNAEKEFRWKLFCLWASPRIEEPVWLSLMSKRSKRAAVCSKFTHMLISSIKEHTAMGRKKFLSSLITAVLTHHVGWVPTVYDEDLEVLLNHGNKRQDWGDSGAFFNALGLQLSDAHGALCWPLHLARTVVVGEEADAVAKLLFLLTFFIRCPDIIDHSQRLVSTCQAKAVEAFGRSESSSSRSLSPPVLAEIQDRLAAVKESTPPLDRKFVDGRTTGLSPGVTVGSYSRHRNAFSHCSPGSSVPQSTNISPVFFDRKTRTAFGDRQTQTRAQAAAESTTTARRSGDFSADGFWPSPPTASSSSQSPPLKEPHQSASGSPSKSLLSSSLEKYEREMAMASVKESEKKVEDFIRLLTGLTEISSMEEQGENSRRSSKSLSSSTSSGQQDVNTAPLHKNLGRSLFGGLCSEYQSDFVLHGTCQRKGDVVQRANDDLRLAVNHSIVNSMVDSAVCIVVDTDKWTCEVFSQSRPAPNIDKSALPTDGSLLEERTTAESAKLVQSLLTAVEGAWDLGMPEEMCLIHLEDGLRQILLKSQMAAEYLSRQTAKLDHRQLQALFGVDSSDMNLLLSVARVFWPQMGTRM